MYNMPDMFCINLIFFKIRFWLLKLININICTNPKEYARIIRLSRERNAGWLMITDDVMPNPYDREPSKFVEMVNMINK